MAEHAGTARIDRAGCRRPWAAGPAASSLEWYDCFVYATAAALVFGHVFCPRASAPTGTLVSDRLGRRPPIVAGAALIALWAFPLFWLGDTGNLTLIIVALVVGGIGSSLTYGPVAACLGEVFEPRVRDSGRA